MTYLVLGGTGTVGGAVVRGLQARGADVRVLTRSEEKARTLPEGVTPVVGDLMAPDTYARIFDGVQRLFLLNAVSPTELHEGLAALNEARRAGVEHIVYLSVHEAEKGLHIPHFAAKVALEAALKATGPSFTILRPNNFYQNDLWAREALLQYGLYPHPIGTVGLSRVDVRDIAEAAVNALTDPPSHRNRTYALVGPDVLGGQECAAIYARALGRPVRYGGDDLAAWAAQVRGMLPDWAVYDLRLMYALFQQDGLRATEAQLDETRAILGHEPRRFDDFVRETVAAWT